LTARVAVAPSAPDALTSPTNWSNQTTSVRRYVRFEVSELEMNFGSELPSTTEPLYRSQGLAFVAQTDTLLFTGLDSGGETKQARAGSATNAVQAVTASTQPAVDRPSASSTPSLSGTATA